MTKCWEELLAMAEGEVDAVRRGLPLPLKAQAAQASVAYQPRASTEEGEPDFDLLGLFVGNDMLDLEAGIPDLPACIHLFLETIWEFAEQEDRAYRREVRKTYLHELGHFLGLDELDLDDREMG